MSKTIETAGAATKAEIKTLAREDTNTQLGVTIATVSALSTVDSKADTGISNAAAVQGNLDNTQADLTTAEGEIVTAKSDVSANKKDINSLRAKLDDNLPDNVFDISVARNTRNAVISRLLNAPAHVSHIITMDDNGATPALGDAWVAGEVVTDYLLPDWWVHIYYLWLRQADDTLIPVPPVAELSDQGAVPGLVLSAKDTDGPVWVSTGLAIVDDAYTITPPGDAGTGLASVETYDVYIDGTLSREKFTAATGTFDIPADGAQHEVQVFARDVAGNTSASNMVFVTRSVGSGGTIGFKSTASGAAEGDSLVVTLTRLGGSVASSVTVSTYDGTAKVGVGYTALVNEPVDFTIDGDVSVTVPILSPSSPLDNDFYLTVDYGSGGAGVDIATERHYIVITGAGGTGTAGFQGADASPWDVTVKCDDANVTVVPGSAVPTDTWNQTIELYDRTLNSTYMAPTADYGSSNDPKLDITSPYIPYQLDLKGGGAYFNFWLRGYRMSSTGTTKQAHVALMRDILSISADAQGTGGASYVLVKTVADHGYVDGDKIFFEGTTGHDNTGSPPVGYVISSAGTNQFDILNLGLAAQGAVGRCFGEDSLLGISMPITSGNNEYGWETQDRFGADRVAYIPAAGVYEMRLYAQDKNYVRCDRFTFGLGIVFADVNVAEAGVRTHVADDHFGKLASPFTAGGAGISIPNDENDPFVPYPLPTTVYTVPADDKFPLSGTPGITATTTVRLSFPGMSNLERNFFRLLDSGGVPIPATETITSNSIELRPLQPLPSPATYSVGFEGRITDTDGTTRKKVDSGTWTFTTGDTSAFIFYQDFEGIRP